MAALGLRESPSSCHWLGLSLGRTGQAYARYVVGVWMALFVHRGNLVSGKGVLL